MQQFGAVRALHRVVEHGVRDEVGDQEDSEKRTATWNLLVVVEMKMNDAVVVIVVFYNWARTV